MATHIRQLFMEPQRMCKVLQTMLAHLISKDLILQTRQVATQLMHHQVLIIILRMYIQIQPNIMLMLSGITF